MRWLLVVFILPALAIPNPAAVYCTNLGYEYKIKSGPEGEYGVCILPNGEEVDDWGFFLGKTGLEYSACARLGLEPRIEEDPACRKYLEDKCLICVGDGIKVDAESAALMVRAGIAPEELINKTGKKEEGNFPWWLAVLTVILGFAGYYFVRRRRRTREQ